MKFFWCLGVMRGRTAVICAGKGAACGGGTSMATTASLPAPEAQSQPAISSIGRIIGVFFSPKATFEDIASKPSWAVPIILRSEEHTSELQSHSDLVCRLLL